MTNMDILNPVTPVLSPEEMATIMMQGREKAHELRSEFFAALGEHTEDNGNVVFAADFDPASDIDMSARAQFLDSLLARPHETKPDAFVVRGRVTLFEISTKIAGINPEDPLVDVLYLTTLDPSAEA